METAKKKQSIKNRIFFPTISLVVIQLFLLLCIYLFGGLTKAIDDQSWSNLGRGAENQQNYLRNKMIREWGNIENYQSVIVNKMEEYLDSRSLDPETVLKDSELADKLIMDNSDLMVEMLRETKSTGAYIILNQLDRNKCNMELPAFYVRDLDPDSGAVNNADLQIQIALPKITRRLEISLASEWSARIHLNEDYFENLDFFYVPYEDAKENSGKDTTDYGYWSGLFVMGKSGDRILTYSIPLIVKNEVIGILGIDVSESELEEALRMNTDYHTKDSCIILGKISGEKGNVIQVVKDYGRLFSYNFGTAKKIGCHQLKEDQYHLDNEKRSGDTVCASLSPLQVYSKNSVHYNDRWVIAACENASTLFEASDNVKWFLICMTVGTLLLMILVVNIASKRITEPIRRVVADFGSLDVSKKFDIQPTNIEELDELLSAFARVKELSEEYARKVSDMIEITNLPLGIFEYHREKNVVFYSKSLFPVLEWGEDDRENSVMEGDIFIERFETVRKTLVDEEKSVYLINRPDGSKKWLSIHLEEKTDCTIGAVIDVTNEVMEKEKISHERDYDMLTGLLNRRAFRKKVFALTELAKERQVGAVIMADTDNLKYVNDTYGHEVGDSYLERIAQCLKEFEKYGGICGRRSGDEFYFFLYGFQSKEEIREIVAKVWDHLNTTYLMLPDHQEFRLRCSAGIAWYPEDHENMDTLIRYADFAMYLAKQSCKGSYVEFEPDAYRKKFCF